MGTALSPKFLGGQEEGTMMSFYQPSALGIQVGFLQDF
jgi:hypothetical protein